MAHGTGAYASGVISSGANRRYQLMQLFIAQLTGYQSNGENAWEIAHTFSATEAIYDVMMHSVGDRSLGAGALKGDAELWFRLTNGGTPGAGGSITVDLWQDWSATSVTGNRQGWERAFNADDSFQLEWWSVVNEYAAILVVRSQTTYDMIYFGTPVRPYTDRLNGLARLDAATSTTGAVVLSVDRDITANIQVGQTVWLYNHTPTGQALKADYTELVTVTAKTASTITVSGVVNQPYEIGSLVGLDPCCPLCTTSLTSWYGVNYLDGRWKAADGWQAGSMQSLCSHVGHETDWDPGPDGTYTGFRAYAYQSAAATGYPGGFRGYLDHIRLFSRDAQVDKDVYRVEWNDADKWKFFPTALSGMASYFYAIGPGAS